MSDDNQDGAKMTGNDFPKLNINTQDLIDAAELHIQIAAHSDSHEFGGVNWGDIGVMDVEYRLSMMDQNAKPICVVMIEEAHPGSKLAEWVRAGLIADGFPECVYVECEW